MTREEAIEVYNGLLNEKIKEAFEFFVPELAENEDERIRKAIMGLTYIDGIEPILTKCSITAQDIRKYLEKQKAKERLDRMAPIYNDKESFESALEKAWKYYNESASRTVDSFEDDYIECVFSKGFREGFLYKEKQKEQKDYNKLYEDIAKSEWFKKAYEGKSLECNYEQKEQKPIQQIDIRTTFGYKTGFQEGQEAERRTQKPELYDMGRWDEESYNNGIHHVLQNPEAYGLTKQKPEWNEEDEKALREVKLNFEINHEDMTPALVDCYERFFHKVETISPQPKQEWSEEDILTLDSIISIVEDWESEQSEKEKEYYGATQKSDFLKSFRPQSKDEIYKEKDEAFKLGKHQLAIGFMNYLDKNRPEGKMCLSNGECEDIDKAFKENDWNNIIRYIEKYKPYWKPSREQMDALYTYIYRPQYADTRPYGDKMVVEIVESLYNELKKLV